MKLRLSLMASLLAFSFCALAQEWTLSLNKDNIRVYTREVANSSLDEFKAECTINVSLSEVQEALLDADHHKDWSAATTVSKVISRNGNVQYNYTVSDAPFPVSDRDSYMKFTVTESEGQTRIDMVAVPTYGPEKDDMVRIQKSQGFYLLEELGPNRTKVTYQLHAEPGGSIPGWLANSASTEVPYKSLKGLKEYLE